MISLNGLNPEQRKAAETVVGPLLILAGAGSGKTRTVTYRIAHMLDNLKIPGSEILAVSFTNKAAAEMKERVAHLVSSKIRKGITLSTFHSLGIRILREDIHHLGYNNLFTIYDQADQMSIVREGLKNYRSGKNFDRGIVMAKIGLLKNKGISAKNFQRVISTTRKIIMMELWSISITSIRTSFSFIMLLILTIFFISSLNFLIIIPR